MAIRSSEDMLSTSSYDTPPRIYQDCFNALTLISLHSFSIPSNSFCIASGESDRSLRRKNQLRLVLMVDRNHMYSEYI